MKLRLLTRVTSPHMPIVTICLAWCLLSRSVYSNLDASVSKGCVDMDVDVFFFLWKDSNIAEQHGSNAIKPLRVSLADSISFANKHKSVTQWSYGRATIWSGIKLDPIHSPPLLFLLSLSASPKEITKKVCVWLHILDCTGERKGKTREHNQGARERTRPTGEGSNYQSRVRKEKDVWKQRDVCECGDCGECEYLGCMVCLLMHARSLFFLESLGWDGYVRVKQRCGWVAKNRVSVVAVLVLVGEAFLIKRSVGAID